MCYDRYKLSKSTKGEKMKTPEQRLAAKNRKYAKKMARQNAAVNSVSSASVWEGCGKVRIYLNNIGLNGDCKCFIEAMECGVSHVRFAQHHNDIDESLASKAVAALKAKLNINTDVVDSFVDIVAAMNTASGRITFQF